MDKVRGKVDVVDMHCRLSSFSADEVEATTMMGQWAVGSDRARGQFKMRRHGPK